ncbi:hypothetical protein Tsubulata_008950 [Turnera subulata]|uniref:AMP-dependent synthetase/ligase domain-containing protein n=1 Tax=Turnera subulata TaxID=218843 RepID=A0A9Q0FR33_9ROSI|nr:hypothetical protein Tsubulata_008950 [Turnera subulata]
MAECDSTPLQAGPYVWQTYKEVYDFAIRLGSAMRSRGVNPVSPYSYTPRTLELMGSHFLGDRCGIYGPNCPEWITTMEVHPYCANAVEFIINHVEVSVAFVQENKLPTVSTHFYCTIVSFGKISSTQKKEAEELGVSCFSWEEFSQLGSLDCELSPKQKSDICTIMYTSGTTGDPKGLLMAGFIQPQKTHRWYQQNLDILVYRCDIGELQPNGAMKIIDRKKNIFKLSQGEYIAVENLENTYSRCPLITSIWVYGNSFESFIVAIVVPDKQALEDWAARNNETDDFKSLCKNPKARKFILDELNATAQKHKVYIHLTLLYRALIIASSLRLLIN